MAKRRFLEISESGPRKKREDPERAEQVREMWLKELRKIIGGWTVGSDSTKRSEPDYQLELSEVVKPKRFHKQSRVASPISSQDLIDLVMPPTERSDFVENELGAVAGPVFVPKPRKPYIEMSSSEIAPELSVSPPLADAADSMESSPSPPTTSAVRSVPSNPFVPIEISCEPVEPMAEDPSRVRPRRMRVSGKQATTTGCYLLILFVFWVIIRITFGELLFSPFVSNIDVLMILIRSQIPD